METLDPSIKLSPQLMLLRCPHCNVDTPNLEAVYSFDTHNHKNSNKRHWTVYVCKRCGGVVTASAEKSGYSVREFYPMIEQLDPEIPESARTYLEQARQSLHAPAGAVMLAASAVDAMLKAKNYKDGDLNTRIKKATDDHVITADMSTWAHQVRLDANDQRHADEHAPLPTEVDAQRSVHFASALATFLFTLPSMVTRGIKDSTTGQSKKGA